jgi:glycosyltransferase involved in cell wall biosynthesis
VKILMVSDTYPPSIGGLQRHVRDLGIELVARGHQVSVATLWQSGLAEHELDHGVSVHRIRTTMHRVAGRAYLDPSKMYAPPFPDPEAVQALRRIVANERPHIVHAHNWLVHSFLPLKAWSRARLVVTLHEYGLVCAKWVLMYRDEPCSGPGLGKCLGCATEYYGAVKGPAIALSNFVSSRPERSMVDRFLPVSEAGAIGTGLGDGRTRYRVVPNFIRDDVATSPAAADPRLSQLPEGDFILFVGALTRTKGLEVLLEAYAGLGSAPPLVLIGSEWKDTPTTFPPNVIVLKNWSNEAVMAAWGRCLFGLAPSRWPEPCPTVVMEAMAAGRPVIATRIGGIPDIVVEGETGLLVPPDDPAALRSAMRRLLDDAQLRSRMGTAARDHATTFMAHQVIGQIEDVYRHVVG